MFYVSTKIGARGRRLAIAHLSGGAERPTATPIPDWSGLGYIPSVNSIPNWRGGRVPGRLGDPSQ
jgi:hypothetical protein